MSTPLPALFVGHGNPMNALQENAWTRAWAALGAALPRPRAVLAISAHWYISATAVTAMATPRTIHDFGGFPRELFEVRYPAPGDADLAARVQQLLAPLERVGGSLLGSGPRHLVGAAPCLSAGGHPGGAAEHR